MNIVKYLKMFCPLQSQHRESQAISEEESGAKTVDTSQYYNKPFDLYWLEATSLTASQVCTATSKSLDSTGSQISVQKILSMHNSKRTYKEYVEFTENFAGAYDRFFSSHTNETIEKVAEYVRASSCLVSLMLKSFGLPGRIGAANSLEESKSMFVLQYK